MLSSKKESIKPTEEINLRGLMHAYMQGENNDFWLVFDRINSIKESEAQEFHSLIKSLHEKNKLTTEESLLLAVGLQKGIGITTDANKSEILLHQLADNNIAQAHTLLAIYIQLKNQSKNSHSEVKHINSSDDKSNSAISYQHLLDAIKFGDSRACGLMAKMYMNGEDVTKDIQKAKTYAEKGIERGDSYSMRLLKFLKIMNSAETELLAARSVTKSHTPNDKSAEEFRRALDIDPKNQTARNGITRIYNDSNKFLSRLNPFKKGENFIIRFNMALSQQDKSTLENLFKENPKKFNELCKQENLDYLSSLLSSKIFCSLRDSLNMRFSQDFISSYSLIFRFIPQKGLTRIVFSYAHNYMDNTSLAIIEDQSLKCENLNKSDSHSDSIPIKEIESQLRINGRRGQA